MPSNDTREAHDYAERIRERLPRRLQELREAARLSKYALERESGISREFIGRLERGEAYPTVPVTAQLSHGIGMTLAEFTSHLEERRGPLIRPIQPCQGNHPTGYDFVNDD